MILLKRYDPLRLPGGCRNATLSVSTYVTLWPPTLALCLIRKKSYKICPYVTLGITPLIWECMYLFSLLGLEPVAT